MATVETEVVPDGTFVRGTFGGVGSTPDGRFSFLVIHCQVGHEKPFQRRLDFVAYNPGTGKATPLGETLETLAPGERVEVTVFADAKSGGRSGQWVSLRASAIRRI